MTNKRIAKIVNQSVRSNREKYWYTATSAFVMTAALIPIVTRDAIEFWYAPLVGTLLFALALVLPGAAKTSKSALILWYTGAGSLAVALASTPLYAENGASLWYVPLVSVLLFAIALIVPDTLTDTRVKKTVSADAEIQRIKNSGATLYSFSNTTHDRASKSAA